MRRKQIINNIQPVIYSLGWVCLVLMLFVSCLPEPLEVKNIPKIKPEIVVATQLIRDNTLVVLLTKTFGALDASKDSDPEVLIEQIAVNDALVSVKGPDGVYELTRMDEGVYGGVFIPFREGETYELHVNSASLGEVYATTTVRSEVKFDSIMADLYLNGYGDTLAQITYSIQDAAEKNWYMINVQEVQQEDAVRNLINPRAYTVLLDDESFNGQLLYDTFRVFPRDYSPGDSIAVTLSNISEDYYKFMKIRVDNRYSFVEFLSEPVNYPSNVVGGKGFFNLYIPDVRFFVFKEEE